jgi:alpha-beta hydrolase superfamily lysophospholipase
MFILLIARYDWRADGQTKRATQRRHPRKAAHYNRSFPDGATIKNNKKCRKTYFLRRNEFTSQ